MRLETYGGVDFPGGDVRKIDFVNTKQHAESLSKDILGNFMLTKTLVNHDGKFKPK